MRLFTCDAELIMHLIYLQKLMILLTETDAALPQQRCMLIDFHIYSCHIDHYHVRYVNNLKFVKKMLSRYFSALGKCIFFQTCSNRVVFNGVSYDAYLKTEIHVFFM